MLDYKAMYLRLFDAVERTLEVMESTPDAKQAVLLSKAFDQRPAGLRRYLCRDRGLKSCGSNRADRVVGPTLGQ